MHGDPLKFTVIVPVLNARRWLDRHKPQFLSLRDRHELILVDGGSRDGTQAFAGENGIRLVTSRPGRGVQMNEGVRLASHDLLLFLHADTRLADDAFDCLDAFFRVPGNMLTTFSLKFDHPSRLLRLYSGFTNYESLWTTFGDQGIAVRRSYFLELGGFPGWPLFEDVHFLRLARRRRRFRKLNASVTTSADRFVRYGCLRQQLFNGYLIVCYLFGVEPARLAARYERRGRRQSNLFKVKEVSNESIMPVRS